jgi:hypothetical protein
MWPTICIDNFFSNQKEILKFAKSLDYAPSRNGHWPGERTKPLHELDPIFFNHITLKIVASLYPNEWENISWKATSYFQKIDSRWKGPGWVHQDVHKQISSVIYLNGDTNCGTVLYKPNTHNTIPSVNEIKNLANLNPIKMKSNDYKKALEEHNKKFTQTVVFNSEINRCIIFDSYQYHAVDNFNVSNKDERITIITFFDSIYRCDGKPLNPHAGESCRI